MGEDDSKWGKEIQRSMASRLGYSVWGKKIPNGVGRFRVGLEGSTWDWKIQSVVRRFKVKEGRLKVGLEDPKWGWKIQNGVGSSQIRLGDSKFGKKIQN